jgi:hypothetical protein
MPKVSAVPLPDVDVSGLYRLHNNMMQKYEDAVKSRTQVRRATTMRSANLADRKAVHETNLAVFVQARQTYLNAYTEAYEALPSERRKIVDRAYAKTHFWTLGSDYKDVPSPVPMFRALHWFPEEDAALPAYYLVYTVVLRPKGTQFVHAVFPLTRKDGVIEPGGLSHPRLGLDSPHALLDPVTIKMITAQYKEEWPDVQVTSEIVSEDARLDLVRGKE